MFFKKKVAFFLVKMYSLLTEAGWSSLVARRAHNPKVVGSNPAPATKNTSILKNHPNFIIFKSFLMIKFLFLKILSYDVFDIGII